MGKNTRTLVAIYLCLLITIGCANNQPELTKSNDINHIINVQNKQQKGTTQGTNQNISIRASEIVKNMDVITDAVAVNDQKDLFLSYKVKHLKRFQLKKIEKQVKKKLENQFPNYSVTVSSDLKLFLETNELKDKIARKQIKPNMISKEIKKLNKLLNEKT